MSEHDFEPVRGLPANLPAGERLLWQGAPDWWALGQRAFHMRSVAIYFTALMVWRGFNAAQQGAPLAEAVQSALLMLPVALVVLGLLAGLAALAARTSVYTITTKRIVMRIGVALPKAINLPFTIIENAALKTYSDKTGDIALTLTQPNKVAYLLLWPHARPIKLTRPEPTLRAVADAKDAAAILAQALEAAQANRGAVVTPVATPDATAPQGALAPA